MYTIIGRFRTRESLVYKKVYTKLLGSDLQLYRFDCRVYMKLPDAPIMA